MADATRCNARFGNKAKTKQKTINNRSNFDHHASLQHARCNTMRCTTMLVLQRNQTEQTTRERKNNTILHDARSDATPASQNNKTKRKQTILIKKTTFHHHFTQRAMQYHAIPRHARFARTQKKKDKKKRTLTAS